MDVHIIDHHKTIIKSIPKSINGAPLNVIVSENIEHALPNIIKQKPQVVIIDWQKKEYTNEQLTDRIKRIKAKGYIYSLIITERENIKEIASVISAGADDYIFYPYSNDDIELRLMVAQNHVLLNKKMSSSRKKLIKLAKEDPPTSLYNRRALIDEAINEMKRSSRELKPFSSLMISITNYSDLLEKHGHIFLNKVLFEFSRRLKNSFRPYDKAGRLNDSDFLAFLPGTTKSNTQKVADRIMDAVTGLPFKIGQEKIKLHVAIGIADLDTDDVVRDNNPQSNMQNELLLDSLINKLGSVVATAKKTGNNTITISD